MSIHHIYVGGDSTTKGENHLRKGGLVYGGGDLSMEGETCLWRGRLVCGGGDLSTEGETRLWRGIFVYGGEDSSTEARLFYGIFLRKSRILSKVEEQSSKGHK